MSFLVSMSHMHNVINIKLIVFVNWCRKKEGVCFVERYMTPVSLNLLIVPNYFAAKIKMNGHVQVEPERK